MKRVYTDIGGGMCQPVAMALDPATGGYVKTKAPSGEVVSILRATANGHPVLSNSQINAIAPDLTRAESSNGKVETARIEVSGVKSGDNLPNHTHSISLTNAHASNTYTAVLGDAMGLVSLYQNIPALSGDVTVAGTFGAATLTQILAMAQVAPLDYHGMHVECGSSGYYTSGAIKVATATPDNNGVQMETVNLSMITSDATNSPTIRKNLGFRMGLFGNVAMLISVPPSSTVNITLGLEGAGLGTVMKKF